jgi:putative membrane protein
MTHVHDAAIESFPLLVTLIIIVTVFAYLRLWIRFRSVSAWHAASFLLGAVCVWIAYSSPVAALHHELLTGHMIQHLLLMTLAPPLIWLGKPLTVAAVYDRRLYSTTKTEGPRPPLQLCWLGATLTLAVWHIPAVFTLAMRSAVWHTVEQTSFLATGLLFWRPVVQPSAGWSMILYLFLATLPCDILSGFLVFSERVTYSVYLSMPRNSDLSVLADQQLAGALMWTCVTIVYLVAGTILSTRLLSTPRNLHSMEAM